MKGWVKNGRMTCLQFFRKINPKSWFLIDQYFPSKIFLEISLKKSLLNFRKVIIIQLSFQQYHITLDYIENIVYSSLLFLEIETICITYRKIICLSRIRRKYHLYWSKNTILYNSRVSNIPDSPLISYSVFCRPPQPYSALPVY